MEVEGIKFRRYVVPEKPGTLQDLLRDRNIPDIEENKPRRDLLRRSLEEPAKGIRELAHINGVTLPEEDLSSRVHLVDHEVASKLFGAAMAIAFKNRVCVIDYEELVMESKQRRADLEVRTGTCASHEIWHSLLYSELWVPENEIDVGPRPTQHYDSRRHGLVTEKPKAIEKELGEDFDNRYSRGMHIFEEGLVDYFTAKSHELVGIKMIYTYPQPASIARLLAKQIGEDILMQAALTKDGFRNFVEIMESRYGKQGLRRFATIFFEEAAYSHFMRRIGQNVGWYLQGTRSFLKTHSK